DVIGKLPVERKLLIVAQQVEGSIDNELLYKNLKFQQEQQALVNAVNNKMKAVADKESEAYKTLKAESDALADQRMAHLNEIFTEHPGTFFTTFKRSGQNPITRDIRQADGSVDGRAQVYYYRNEFWDNVNFDDERLLYTPVISNKLDRYMKKLTDQNADSLKVSADKLLGRVLDKPEYYKYIANWIAVNYEPGKVEIMDAEAVYVHMVQNYFTYDRAFWSDSAQVYALQLRANEMSQSLVGQKAPLITSTNQFGQSVSMADIQSKYIAVFMYNPTCDHCIEQTPQLVELYKKLKPRGLEVFAIALDTEDAVWKDFIKKYKMDFINVWDPTNRSIYGKYYVDNTPEVYLLDEDRVLFAKNIKVNQIEEAIRLHEEK
ncbi:MAG: redoxin domain-containing protein, partial [Bacteroidota bacterium]